MCISLVMIEVEHLFVCLLTAWISCLGGLSFSYCFMWILDVFCMSSLEDICIENIFFHSETCAFIFLWCFYLYIFLNRKGIRIYRPKMCQWWHISNWRKLRNSKHRKNSVFPLSSGKQGKFHFLKVHPSSKEEENDFYHQKPSLHNKS